MSWAAIPVTAAWSHLDARSGFEVVYLHTVGTGYRIEGCTTAVEDGRTWIVEYEITLDADWFTRTARATGLSATGRRAVLLEADGAGHWLVDGAVAPHLDGCLDVDLESSALTNALPVHRLALPVGGRAAAPAAYLRTDDLSVMRLEQDYLRTSDQGAYQCYDYTAPAYGFACRLTYDESGLVLSYPGIAVRVA
ncbi:putative glycolipid-binding domain-containing protein [Nocardia sp. NBC_00416]|uniref:putative glycolipid-binding domain-containing protein n=1 Tax=Nocardia sp. NBC_00416 TaxID=2975991 RepID=UPI002E20D7D8